MSLQDWLTNHWLRVHRTTPEEITGLLNIVDRDIADMNQNLSEDWSFSIAYNAALKLCTILLYAEGYEAEKTRFHYWTINSVPLILGERKRADTEYLDTCRIKRNTSEYVSAGMISASETEELKNFIKAFKTEVINWLGKKHPELV